MPNDNSTDFDPPPTSFDPAKVDESVPAIPVPAVKPEREVPVVERGWRTDALRVMPEPRMGNGGWTLDAPVKTSLCPSCLYFMPGENYGNGLCKHGKPEVWRNKPDATVCNAYKGRGA